MRKTLRPMRPKPLMAMRMAMASELLLEVWVVGSGAGGRPPRGARRGASRRRRRASRDAVARSAEARAVGPRQELALADRPRRGFPAKTGAERTGPAPIGSTETRPRPAGPPRPARRTCASPAPPRVEHPPPVSASCAVRRPRRLALAAPRPRAWACVPTSRSSLALSGGADSVLLLHLLHVARAPAARRLAAVHVDHGLRGARGPRRRRLLRRAVPRGSGVPLAACAAWRSSPTAPVLEARAREARYRVLVEEARASGRTTIAHRPPRRRRARDPAHALDPRHAPRRPGRACARAAGLRAAPDTVLARAPALGMRRAEIRRLLADARASAWREDSSNRDLRFARNRVRARLLPRLERARRPRPRRREPLRLRRRAVEHARGPPAPRHERTWRGPPRRIRERARARRGRRDAGARTADAPRAGRCADARCARLLADGTGRAPKRALLERIARRPRSPGAARATRCRAAGALWLRGSSAGARAAAAPWLRPDGAAPNRVRSPPARARLPFPPAARGASARCGSPCPAPCACPTDAGSPPSSCAPRRGARCRAGRATVELDLAALRAARARAAAPRAAATASARSARRARSRCGASSPTPACRARSATSSRSSCAADEIVWVAGVRAVRAAGACAPRRGAACGWRLRARARARRTADRDVAGADPRGQSGSARGLGCDGRWNLRRALGPVRSVAVTSRAAPGADSRRAGVLESNLHAVRRRSSRAAGVR